MSNEAALKRYERACDANSLRQETLEPLVRDAMMDAIEMRDPHIEAQFIEFLCDDAKAFIWVMLNPEPRTHKEVIYQWRERWVRYLLDEYGFEQVDRLYRLHVI